MSQNGNSYKVPYMALLNDVVVEKIKEYLKIKPHLKVIVKSNIGIGVDDRGVHTMFSQRSQVWDLSPLFKELSEKKGE